jgi:hypothetical protein
MKAIPTINTLNLVSIIIMISMGAGGRNLQNEGNMDDIARFNESTPKVFVLNHGEYE